MNATVEDGKRVYAMRGANPVDLDLPIRGRVKRKLLSMVRGPLEKLLSLDKMYQIYNSVPDGIRGAAFARNVLERMRVRYEVSGQEMARIPKTGPVVVVANHPFGGIEGVMLAALLQEVRPDVKIMANFLLERIEEMRELFIFVDPFGAEGSATANLKGMRQTIGWLKDGGMLGVFPAGEVAHLQLRRREVIDPAWSETIARIVRRTEATVLPIYFRGGNSALFQMMGLVHPRLRTAMLPHEFLNKAGHTFNICIGNPITWEKLSELPDDSAVMACLRQRTYLLGCKGESKVVGGKVISNRPAAETEGFEPVAAAIAGETLAAEVAGLGEKVLIDTSDYSVIAAKAGEIPNVLRELGRLREITFRQTGEGTGKAVDIDEFDRHYIHMFAWSKEKKELIGAYRLGPTDEILKEHGPEGLYISTLFNFKPQLLKKFNPALELGRSFVRAEYQRNYAPLMLLWKGIGSFVVRNPRYKMLVGPVSISNSYNSISRQMMVAFLQTHLVQPELAKFVQPRTPFSLPREKSSHLQAAAMMNDIEDVSSLVSEIEPDEKGVPILLKQYLKLGGKALGFNLDPNFSDALDGLLYVDLTQTDRRVLHRYMGKDGAEQFLAHHKA